MLRDELRTRAAQLLHDLLGPPSNASARELRWGSHGSLAYSIEQGVYFDHEEGEGGDLIDLIMRARNADFGAALDWIRDYLGGQYREPPTTLSLPSRNSSPPRRDRVGLAAQIWRASMEACGTAAERYLHRRAIRYMSADVRYAPSAVFGRIAGATWVKGACVVFRASDASGRGRAVQLVRIYDDGRPVTANGRKLKFCIGGLHGASVRLPGAPAPAPLFLAEGAETAASVAQLTCCECWAMLGSVARADLSGESASRPTIVAADDDPIAAPSAIALRDRLLEWRLAGRNVRVIYPWAVRRYDKSDFNDLLQAGEAAARSYLAELRLPDVGGRP